MTVRRKCYVLLYVIERSKGPRGRHLVACTLSNAEKAEGSLFSRQNLGAVSVPTCVLFYQHTC